MAFAIVKNIKKFYCAFCKSPRKVNAQKHIGIFEFFISTAASVLLTLIFFGGFDARIIPIFSIFICLFEFFIQIKYRVSLQCPHCGFDPILYMKSKEKACNQVKSFLEAKKNDPLNLLSTRPKLDLPIRKVNADGKTVAPQKSKNLDIRL